MKYQRFKLTICRDIGIKKWKKSPLQKQDLAGFFYFLITETSDSMILMYAEFNFSFEHSSQAWELGLSCD